MKSPHDDAKTGTRLRIRRARDGDLAALVELEQASFAGDRMSARQWRRHLRSPRAIVVVAVDSEHLLGAAIAFVHAAHDIARLYSLATSLAARGRGVGDRLVAAVERAAHAAGCQRLRLEVREDNTAAQRLYVRRGYRPIGRRAAYYEDGEDALRYEKALGVAH
jgi:ribosomal-protein-alanine N-acetyltransferase